MKLKNGWRIDFHYPNKRFKNVYNEDGSLVMVNNTRKVVGTDGKVHARTPKMVVACMGRVVECFIKNSEGGIVATGQSRAFSGRKNQDGSWEVEPDRFCKVEGRKKALADALKATIFNKNEKREIWEMFRTQSKNPRWENCPVKEKTEATIVEEVAEAEVVDMGGLELEDREPEILDNW